VTATLPENARRLLDAGTVVTLATADTEGSPQASPVWAARDGDDVLISTLVGRKKERNLRQNPRASVVLVDPDDTDRYVEIRGTVSFESEGASELIQTLSQKYTGGPFTHDRPGDQRVVVRVTPQRVTGRS
jgi:PPOX class probable F420-dependent enzyme